MRTISQLPSIQGKIVFLRADFDVAVDPMGNVQEEFRIARQRPMIEHLLKAGARIVIGSHITGVSSFETIVKQLEHHLGLPLKLCKSFDEVGAFLTTTEPVALLENLRLNAGEEANNEAFAGRIVEGCDYYINNAFAVCHRAHASIALAPLVIPSFAGLLVEEEVSRLQHILTTPKEGKLIIMGGAKASTKVPVIQYLLDRSDHVAVGGVLANDILKAQGRDIGTSRVDDDAVGLASALNVHDPRLVVPTDFVEHEGAILDMGPQSARVVADLCKSASLIVWNGPLGIFENPTYRHGTAIIARAIAESSAMSIVGGGDTVSSIRTCGFELSAFDFVSTGGGAMLAFLAGQRLAGLDVLGYRP